MSVQIHVNIISPPKDSDHTVGPKGVSVTVEAWAKINSGGGGGGGGGGPVIPKPPGGGRPNDPHRPQPLDDTADRSPERGQKDPIKILGGQKVDVDSVKVKLGDGEFKTLRSIGNNRYTGSTGGVSNGGTMEITARAMHAGIPGDGVVRSSVDHREINVVVDDTGPEIEITSHDSGDKIEMVGRKKTITVEGRSSDDDSEVDRVHVGVGPASSRVSGSLSKWSHDVKLKGIDSHKIKVRAVDSVGNENDTFVRVTTIDAGKPWLEIISPQQDATFDWPADDKEDLVIEIEGKAGDEETDVKVVEWRLDDEDEDDYKEADNLSGNWSQWKAEVPIPRPGEHTIHFRCLDEAVESGADEPNDVQEAITVHAQRKAEFKGDPASRRSYLKELIKMATRRLKTTDNDDIDAQVLAETFHQPFEQLSRADTTVRKIATRPAHQIRVSIEVLRRFLGEITGKAETTYCRLAYQSMLRNLGTSHKELHQARLENKARRKSLAKQLGIEPAHLDDLILDSDTIEEDDLERLFGLADTRHDPLSGSTDPVRQSELLSWRREYLRIIWRQRDHTGGTVTPIIDPDLVSRSDLKNEDGPAYGLWKKREHQLNSMLTDIEEAHDESTVEDFDKLVEKFLKEDLDFDLQELAGEREKGVDIKEQLNEADLDLKAFLHLLRIRHTLDKERKVLDSEWTDLFNILLQVQKRRHLYSEWMEKEREKALTLSPDYFKIRENVNEGNQQERSEWRSGYQARRRWEETLKARIRQRGDLEDSLRKAVEATEETALPELRKVMLDKAAEEHEHIDMSNWLTKRLLIDVSSSPDLKTTRLRQAIETMQNILFSVRSGRFNTLPVLDKYDIPEFIFNQEQDYTASDFDREWEWLGTYKSFQAGMSVFMYPENYLLPSTWASGISGQESTPAFKELTEKLRNNIRLTPEAAREHAQEYLKRMRTDPPDNFGLPEGFQLTERRSTDELKKYSEDIKELFDEKADVKKGDHPHQETTPNYLKEIFFFVPVQIALQLEKADEYLASLDWFQLVYAYDFSSDEKRKTYYGLQLEEQVENDYHEPDWLQASFNPHQIVISTSKRAGAYTRFTLLSLMQCFLNFADEEFARETAESLPKARGLYIAVLDLFDLPELKQANSESEEGNPFGNNPMLEKLRQHAENNLLKLQQGRNIAGLERPSMMIGPEAVATGGQSGFGSENELMVSGRVSVQPTSYRYSVLIERTKQLVGLAQQLEASFLSAIEKGEDEEYTLIQAGQDLDLAKAGVELQSLRVQEAENSRNLARLKQDRARIRKDTYQGWIDEGLMGKEKGALDLMSGSLPVPDNVSATIGFPPELLSMSVSYSPSGKMKTWANILSTKASYERREQRWGLQKSLAEKDMQIGSKEIALAGDRVSITKQEQNIAEKQVDQAEEAKNFLAHGQFTNADLYEWMSGILGQVYNYFLQQAASTARLAQRQLAFQRQESPPTYIRSNYWQAPTENRATQNKNGQLSDRRGLTGSARLLQDIYQLDQYAYETKERKLQLSQTFSLARLAPFEFQRFRETGVLLFETPMELFDQAFPGHYMRLIKRVRTSVLALVPPTEGIRATLSASGISRVVIGGESFQTAIVRRDPEEIAFTSPANASGLLELEPEKQDLFLPFEGMGVDTTWELQMPKAANSFDYSTIADVLITIDYTAFNSRDYRRRVIQRLDRTASAERSFSFRNQFPDQWYDLHNPDQTDTPMKVQFDTGRQDFPPNLSALEIQQILLYCVRTGGSSFEIDVEHLHLIADETRIKGGEARTVDGIISTRRANGASWMPFTGIPPTGTWELALPNTTEVKDRFQNEEVEDILFVISYEGQTPAWPE
ncbi:hypothetical protein SAMN05443144_11061 [Fodinibius roseus]|uniref:Uncharacterized protein n=1 Tax=Fodinibius roseus TaxID=1194090 RepID=A0A1M5CS48_9BACT|nr:neuraminidase-like domain-containing protein [Fodinibius roseus]SHF57162.1 hypothetical protein SAMN05443144_11061 [Fodinibius roseus]